MHDNAWLLFLDRTAPFLLFLSLAVGILWLFVPFAIFGIKPRLDRQNELLHSLLNEIRKTTPPDSDPRQPGDHVHEFPVGIDAGIARCNICGVLQKNT